MKLHPSDPDIATVVSRIDDKSLDLQPAFQRGAVWSKQKQRLLIDSILRNWYVPPIHVVRLDDERQVVLDGQQRLQAIYLFKTGQLRVHGSAEPESRDILALDGLFYDELPPMYQRRFDRFTVRVFELSDYQPQEPYELFYRLNQPTTLTAAEKRNAFFGRPREQIKELSLRAAELGMTKERVGFSDIRFSYEDVIARFLWTLESGTLAEKATGSQVTERYRTSTPFAEDIVSTAEHCLATVFGAKSLENPEVRLTKATAHSWLIFAARALESTYPRLLRDFDPFLQEVEVKRLQWKRTGPTKVPKSDPHSRLYGILNDRSSFRAIDASSVLIRDAILWILLPGQRKFAVFKGLRLLQKAAHSQDNKTSTEAAIFTAIEETRWARFR